MRIISGQVKGESALVTDDNGVEIAELQVTFDGVDLVVALFEPSRGMAVAWQTDECIDWELCMRAVAVVVYWQTRTQCSTQDGEKILGEGTQVNAEG